MDIKAKTNVFSKSFKQSQQTAHRPFDKSDYYLKKDYFLNLKNIFG